MPHKKLRSLTETQKSDMLAKFPEDSYDAIERLYGNIVLKDFPKYGEFWERFVGRDINLKSMRWYPIKFPKSFSGKNRREFYRFREEICMAHYSLFCNLAGAYFQLDELKKTINQCQTEEGLFRHWEHFECFYFHLGACFFQIFHLWEILPRSINLKLEEYLKQEHLTKRWGKFKNFHKRTSILRNNIMHYSRGAHKQMEGFCYIPRMVKKGDVKEEKMELWSRQLKRKMWERTDSRMKSDFKRSLQVLNQIHGIFVVEFGKILAKRGLHLK